MISDAQPAMQFNGVDCNNNPVDLFADLDAGKAVVLFYYMPNCGSCSPPVQDIQAMATKIIASNPGKVKDYAFPYQNSTTCAYSSSWVASNNLSTIYAPMDSGATQVAYYGGFGMPTVVLVGGLDHRVLFSALSFSSSDTTIMRDSILALLGTGIEDLSAELNSFEIFPNPAGENITINFDLVNPSDLIEIAVISEGELAGFISRQFNVSGLPDGNYLIRLNVNNKIITEKITVKL